MHRNEQHVEHSAPQQRSRGTQNYFVNHNFNGSAALSTTLAHALSDVTGIDVTDTGFTLNDHVNPAALDQLFEPKADGGPRTNGHLSFTIWNYQVTVYSNGQIAIVPPRQGPPAPR